MTALALTLAIVSLAVAEPKLDVKAEKVPVPPTVEEPIRTLLGPEAYVLRNEKGDVLLKLWFRSEVPARASEEQVKNGLTYREIPPTTVLGVVEFPQAFIDFRKQEIAEGAYTLRFAIQPETADHLGATPHREFVLLTPVKKDTSPDLIEPKTLIERSGLVTGGDHPAVMMLFPERGKDGGVKLTDKGGGVYSLSLWRPVVADGGRTTLGFAITVGGHAKE
jgi:hypothetical protein